MFFEPIAKFWVGFCVAGSVLFFKKMLVSFFSLLAFVASLVGFASFSAHTAIYSMILTFLFSGIVYYLLTSTYLAIMLFVVYVGAVAMLFVFCVMLLNLSSRPTRAFSTTAYFFLFFYVLGFFVISASTYVSFGLFNLDFFVPPDFLCFTSFFTEPSWSPFSKDQLLTFSIYHHMLPCLMFLGFILFFVTVLVTILFGLGDPSAKSNF